LDDALVVAAYAAEERKIINLARRLRDVHVAAIRLQQRVAGGGYQDRLLDSTDCKLRVEPISLVCLDAHVFLDGGFERRL